MPTGNDDAAPAYKVDVLMEHPQATVMKVMLAPGAETPPHSHEHDYVVHPQADAQLVKTTYQAGAVVGQEDLEHKASQPYFVFRSADGVSHSIKNVGSTAMMCEKTLIPPPRGQIIKAG